MTLATAPAPAWRRTLRRESGAGLTVAVITLINSFAYASLLASGKIAALLPTVLASAFLATAVMSLVLARFHSLPSAIGGPAGTAAAVVGAALSAVIVNAASPVERSADVAVVLAVTALLPGIVMLVLWRFRLGRAIRFVPYPVVAGFLGGIGWLSIVGATRMVAAGAPLAAAAVFVVVLRVAFGRWKSPSVMPAVVCAGVALAYVVLGATGTSLEQARAAHWYYPALPAAGPAFITPAALHAAGWSAIANAWSAFVWVVIVVVLLSMMNGAALEVESGLDTDVDRDLAALGGASVATALLGGFGSQLVLPTSTLAAKLAPRSRVPGFVVGGVALVAVVCGGAVIPFLPVPVFAGVIGFVGVRFVEQYVIAGLRTMPPSEAAAVIAMLLCTAFAGLQAALVLGLLVACIAFISNASRHAVVRRRLTLRSARSRVERRPAERRFLDAHGDAVDILGLQGQLFFGSANALYEALMPIVDCEPARRAIVLDLAQVYGIDLSAALSLAKLATRARRRGIALLYANVAPPLERELRRSAVIVAAERVYAHLDDALEVCETLLLDGHAVATSPPGGPAGNDAAPDPLRGASIHAYLEPLDVADAGVLFRAGEFADALYVLVDGKLAVTRDGVHLRTLVPGALVGEMGFFTGDARSATVSALGPAVVKRLTLEALHRIERDQPELLAALHRGIMHLQADRLRSANAETILHA